MRRMWRSRWRRGYLESADCADWGDGRCAARDAGSGGAAGGASGLVYRVGDRAALERSAADCGRSGGLVAGSRTRGGEGDGRSVVQDSDAGVEAETAVDEYAGRDRRVGKECR